MLKSNKIKCLVFDSFSQYGFYVLKCHSALDKPFTGCITRDSSKDSYSTIIWYLRNPVKMTEKFVSDHMMRPEVNDIQIIWV